MSAPPPRRPDPEPVPPPPGYDDMPSEWPDYPQPERDDPPEPDRDDN